MKKLLPLLLIMLGILEIILGIMDIKMPVIIALTLGVLFVFWGIKILMDAGKK